MNRVVVITTVIPMLKSEQMWGRQKTSVFWNVPGFRNPSANGSQKLVHISEFFGF